MKKLVAVIVLLVMVVSVANAQSRMYAGQKSSKEIKRAQGLFWAQIDVIEDKIAVIEKRGNKPTKRLRYATRVGDSSEILIQQQTLRQDSLLIADYRQQINALEMSANALVMSAADDHQTFISGRGNVRDVANAYVLAKYYEDGGSSAKELEAVVVNKWHKPVHVKVVGPGGFEYTNYLQSKTEVEFTVPVPGIYIVTFTHALSSRTVSKKVGPMTVHMYKGEQRALVAMLLDN